MLATVLHGPGDIRLEEVDDPKILKPTDAIIKLSATCICGSDLWPYRGLQPMDGPAHMGHEYCGVVVEVGSEVKTVKPGQFVVGSFCLSDNTCPHCRFGFQSSCEQREFMSGAQAPYARVPLADGTLVATAEMPVRGTDPQPAGDIGRVGHRLVRGGCGAGSARLDGGRRRRRCGGADGGALGQADGRRPHHRHEPAQEPAGPRAGVWRDRHRLGTGRSGRRADQGVDQRASAPNSVLECVGTQESMNQAIQCARPGAMIGYVGVPHGVQFDGQ